MFFQFSPCSKITVSHTPLLLRKSLLFVFCETVSGFTVAHVYFCFSCSSVLVRQFLYTNSRRFMELWYVRSLLGVLCSQFSSIVWFANLLVQFFSAKFCTEEFQRGSRARTGVCKQFFWVLALYSSLDCSSH